MGENVSNINWLNGEAQVTTNLKVHDCLWLPQWNRLVNEEDGLTDEVKDNLINLCSKLEVVRHFLGDAPIIIHCMFRPLNYNEIVGGARGSAHLTGQAADFHIMGHNSPNGCNDIRNQLKDHLEEFDLRMEDMQGPWLHLDTRSPHPNRFFKP